MEDVPDIPSLLTYNMFDSVFFVRPHYNSVVYVDLSVKYDSKMLW